MCRAAVFVAVAMTLAGGCATVQTQVGGPPPPRRPARDVDPRTLVIEPVRFTGEQAYAFFDGNTGASLTFDQVLERAMASSVIMVGEQHDQEPHHELQRRVVAAVAAKSPKTIVGLEMLNWNHQEQLDRFNEGKVDADTLASEVDWKKSWGFPFEMYRPIFVDGKAAGASFIALNAPRDLVKAVRKKGVNGLSNSELRQLPDLDLGDPLHQQWFAELFQEGGHPVKDTDLQSFYVAQVVWDESMAEGAAKAIQKGASKVIVLAGIGHVARGRGVPQRVERRLPDAKVLSIVPLPGVDSENAEIRLRAAIAQGEGDIIAIPRFEEELVL
jgi:uncharacterized iron-regulated protein